MFIRLQKMGYLYFSRGCAAAQEIVAVCTGNGYCIQEEGAVKM